MFLPSFLSIYRYNTKTIWFPPNRRGAKEAVVQWTILRSRKRPEWVNRSKQQVEATAMPAASTEIADRARKSPGGRSTPNRNFCYDFLGIQKNLINRSGFFGSPGRARTYNPSVNSRMLCHWATEEYGIRRRPTLPDRYQSSTIGTEELNFCVRYGNRWNLFVIATGNGELFSSAPWQLHSLLRFRNLLTCYVFLLPMISLWTNHEIKPSTY